MMTLEIGRQASRHFAACTKQVQKGYASEGCGPASQSLMDNVTKHVVTYDDVKRLGGYVEVTDEPGLGVQLDEEKVRKYAVNY
jgi:L-alanine-DL-glutamate epimerase-like enolase superfamily enzyme